MQMTRVDFYILAGDELNDRHQFCCKLIAKTFKMGHRIILLCQDDAEAQLMDDLLWSYKDSSFLPHQNLSSSQVTQSHEENEDIIILSSSSHDNAPLDHHDLLINMAAEIPAWFSRFERVSEIVVQTKAVLDSTRANYRFYTEKNYPLHRHDMR